MIAGAVADAVIGDAAVLVPVWLIVPDCCCRLRADACRRNRYPPGFFWVTVAVESPFWVTLAFAAAKGRLLDRGRVRIAGRLTVAVAGFAASRWPCRRCPLIDADLRGATALFCVSVAVSPVPFWVRDLMSAAPAAEQAKAGRDGGGDVGVVFMMCSPEWTKMEMTGKARKEAGVRKPGWR